MEEGEKSRRGIFLDEERIQMETGDSSFAAAI